MNKPCLILVSGIPASGKTTIAEHISKELGYPTFILDKIKELISDRISGREDSILFDKIAKSSYDVLYYLLEEVLKSDNSCIAEAFFLSTVSEPRIKELKSKYDCKLIQVYLKCDFEIAKNRYVDRHNRGDRHKCHIPDMSKVVDEERIGQTKLNCCDHTIELDTNDFTNIDYNNLYSEIKKFIS
jgi:predicted kinase